MSPDYQRIDLSWAAIAGTDRFDVLRSSPKGDNEWTVVATNLKANTFSDHNVRYGQEYLYAVRPADNLGVLSGSSRGTSLAAPVKKFEIVAADTGGGEGALATVGGYTYFAAKSGGLSIYDVALSGSLKRVGSVDTDAATDLAIFGDYAYVAVGDLGYRICNVSDPRAPYEVSRGKTVDARSIATDGTYLYVADGTAGIKVINISDSLNPREVFRKQTEPAARVALFRDKLVVITGAGLAVYSLANRERPEELTSLPLENPIDAGVDARYAYVVERGRGLAVVDLLGAGNPTIAGRLALPSVSTIMVRDDFAYLSSDDDGFWAVDISDPAVPSAFEHMAGGRITDIAAKRRYRVLMRPGRSSAHHCLPFRTFVCYRDLLHRNGGPQTQSTEKHAAGLSR
ncbi:MAG: hypothetical protein HC888_17060 [Candidatus Competibacteraceae bacterium]|nr:hypothetical protein [Candidatus Competibacteraceae bacterium]